MRRTIPFRLLHSYQLHVQRTVSTSQFGRTMGAISFHLACWHVGFLPTRRNEGQARLITLIVTYCRVPRLLLPSEQPQSHVLLYPIHDVRLCSHTKRHMSIQWPPEHPLTACGPPDTPRTIFDKCRFSSATRQAIVALLRRRVVS